MASNKDQVTARKDDGSTTKVPATDPKDTAVTRRGVRPSIEPGHSRQNDDQRSIPTTGLPTRGGATNNTPTPSKE